MITTHKQGWPIKGLNYRVQSPCCGEAGPIYTFKRNQKFLGPFPYPWGAFAFHFRIPHLTLLITIFLPNFRPQFSLPSSLYSTSWWLFNFLMITTHKQGWPMCGPSPIYGPSSPHITLTPTGKRWIPTSNVTPTPLPPLPPLHQNWPKGTLYY